jgi:hypothetical protein
MRRRPSTVLFAVASGLMLLSIGIIAALWISQPLGIMDAMILVCAFWFGIPLSLLIALVAAICYFLECRWKCPASDNPTRKI